jgi:hypothetical protein
VALAATGTCDGRKTARGDRKLRMMRVAAHPCEGSSALPPENSGLLSIARLLPFLFDARREAGSDSGNTKSTKIKFTKEHVIATQKTDVTLCSGWSILPALRKGIGFLISHAPITGPRASPIERTPVKRAKIVAREPGDVQSVM